ncbi:porin [soil metagenome]
MSHSNEPLEPSNSDFLNHMETVMKSPLVIAIACLGACSAATAQSSVTLYGSLDLGPVYVSNVGGAKAKRLTGGTTQPDRFGFRGVEDLGDGLSAIYGLEAGIAPDTGTQINPTKFWNREAKVGLASKTMGTIVLGHLSDALFDYVGKYSNGYNLFNFNLFHPGNFDGLANTSAFDNAIKYISPTLGGVQGMLEVAAGEGVGRSTSAGLNYANGPLRAGLAYSRSNRRAHDIAGRAGIKNALNRKFTPGVMVAMDSVTTFGAGAGYSFGAVSVNAAYTQTAIELGGASTTPRNIDLGATWRTSDLNWVNLGFSNSRFDSTRWNTYSLMDLYWLSKRTQIYAQATLQRASGNGAVAAINGVGLSSTNRQTVLGIGVHHSF